MPCRICSSAARALFQALGCLPRRQTSALPYNKPCSGVTQTPGCFSRLWSVFKTKQPMQESASEGIRTVCFLGFVTPAYTLLLSGVMPLLSVHWSVPVPPRTLLPIQQRDHTFPAVTVFDAFTVFPMTSRCGLSLHLLRADCSTIVF